MSRGILFAGMAFAAFAFPSLAEESGWISCIQEALAQAEGERKPILAYVYDGG